MLLFFLLLPAGVALFVMSWMLRTTLNELDAAERVLESTEAELVEHEQWLATAYADRDRWAAESATAEREVVKLLAERNEARQDRDRAIALHMDLRLAVWDALKHKGPAT